MAKESSFTTTEKYFRATSSRAKNKASATNATPTVLPTSEISPKESATAEAVSNGTTARPMTDNGNQAENRAAACGRAKAISPTWANGTTTPSKASVFYHKRTRAMKASLRPS